MKVSSCGEEQRRALGRIKRYLASPPMLQTPRAGVEFRMYVAAQEHVIGAALTQEVQGKEFVVAYLSRRLVNAETMYTFIEVLCLSLYYSCNKL
jgi:hypothetical protein